MLEARDWNIVNCELDTLKKNRQKMDCVSKYEGLKREIDLVQKELGNVRVVTILSTALSKGWDKNSALGDLKKGRIDAASLADACNVVTEMEGHDHSDDAKELFEVAQIMQEIRLNLRSSLDSNDDSSTQFGPSDTWKLIGDKIGKFEALQTKNPNGKGVKVAKSEVKRVKQEMKLYQTSQDILNALVSGTDAHITKKVEKDISKIEPHIGTLEAAIKNASGANIENSKLEILLKNANHILKIRRSLAKAQWNDVENECILADTALRENINECASTEIKLSMSEAHNQIVAARLETCLRHGGATGEIGNLHCKEIATTGFLTAFKLAEEKNAHAYELRSNVKDLMAWAKLVHELRTAQRAYHPASGTGKSAVDGVIFKMIEEKMRQGSFAEKCIEEEFVLARDDSMLRELKSSFCKTIRRGHAKELPPSNNFCVAAGAREGEKIMRKCNFCKVKSLGELSKGGIRTGDLIHLIEQMEGSKFEQLAPYLHTLKLILRLRQAQLDVDYLSIKAIIEESLSAGQEEGEEDTTEERETIWSIGGKRGWAFTNVLPEASWELKQATIHFRDHEAMMALKAVFDKESGSFFNHDDEEEYERDEAIRRKKSMLAGKDLTVGRRYSMDNDSYEHINFDTVDIEEIDEALKVASDASTEGRSINVKRLMHTTSTVGKLRKCMKNGDWPTVGEIIENLDEHTIHELANNEIRVIRDILKARKNQKMLLEGLKVGAPPRVNGFVDVALTSTRQLELAIARVCAQVASKDERKKSASAIISNGQEALNLEVHWLSKSCERVIKIRSLLKQLDFEGASLAALEASRIFEDETGHYDTEWKHHVVNEVEGYKKELEKRQTVIDIVIDIQQATSRCNVDDLKMSLLRAKKESFESCPDLATKKAIFHGKATLREAATVERNLLEGGIMRCDQEALEVNLKRAKELNLQTKVVERASKELKSLRGLRQRFTNAVRSIDCDSIRQLLLETSSMDKEEDTREDETKKTSYSEMASMPCVDFLQKLPRDVSTYLQLELAKMSAVADRDLEDLIDLTLKIKEKVFITDASQEKFGNIKTFKRLREKEDFARHRMITDEGLANGMLCYSEEAIPASLTRLPTNLSCIAVRMFKQNILGFLGARKFSHPSILLQQVIAVGRSVDGIRDEIYCQILKQMQGVGEEEKKSVKIRLWVLLKMCLER